MKSGGGLHEEGETFRKSRIVNKKRKKSKEGKKVGKIKSYMFSRMKLFIPTQFLEFISLLTKKFVYNYSCC